MLKQLTSVQIFLYGIISPGGTILWSDHPKDFAKPPDSQSWIQMCPLRSDDSMYLLTKCKSSPNPSPNQVFLQWLGTTQTKQILWYVCFHSFFLCFMSCLPIKMFFQDQIIAIWEQGLLMYWCLLLNHHYTILLELVWGFHKFFLLLPRVLKKLQVNPRLLRWGLCLGQPKLTASLLLRGVVPPLHLRWLIHVLE